MSKERVSLSLAVAHSRNRVIGNDGSMPWNQRADLQRFRTMTLEKPVIMGRKTWDSLGGKPLKGRTNIVVSRSELDLPQGAVGMNSISSAIDFAKGKAFDDGLSEVFVIGGGQLYVETIGYADYIYTTEIDATILGDTVFPEIPEEFKPFVISPTFSRDEQNTYDYRYVTYHRKG